MRFHTLAVITISMYGSAAGVQPQTAPAPRAAPQSSRPATTHPTPPAPMTNADVVRMVKAGLADAIVIAAIRGATTTNFRLDADSLIALKTSAVSDPIVAMMLDPRSPLLGAQPPSGTLSPASVPAGPAPAVTGGEGIPRPKEAGIYADMGEGAHTLVALEPTSFSQGKSGGFFTSAITYGIKKAKWKAVVRSAAANFRVRTSTPTFYFYFEQQGSGLSHTGGFAGWMSGASSPNEFVLAKMTQNSRDRELIVGEFGAFGASSGTRSKDTVDLHIEKLSPGAYRVTPAGPLEGGEYCFFYAGGASTFGGGATGKLFDFGIDALGAKD